MATAEDRPEVDAECERAFAEGRTAWPGVSLERAALRRALARLETRRAGSPAGESSTATLTAHPSDLFLAVACDQGAPGAWESFAREFTPRLRGLLRKRGASDSEAAEMLAELPGLLCQPPADGRASTRIGTYDASGSLFSWLAVVALRTVNQKRRSTRPDAPTDTRLSTIVTLRSMPSGAAIADEAARRFEAALSAAWASLTTRERLAVLLRFRDGLSGKEIARMLGVGEPRVSRLVESGLGRLRDAARRQMTQAASGPSLAESTVWKALGEVLAKHLASLGSASHYLEEQGRE